MDWIDPRYIESASSSDEPEKGKEKKKKSRRIAAQVTAALSQPLDVWSAAYGHALVRLRWPREVSLESTWLWSTVMEEQAQVLARAGVSLKKLARVFTRRDASETQTERQPDPLQALMGMPLETIAYQWLDSADAHAHAALGVVALAWSIPEHAQEPSSQWLTQWLQDVVDRIHKYKPDPEDSVLCHLVLQCELPLLIGLATAASKRTVQSEASHAMDNLAQLLEQGQDNPAPWLAHGATYLRAALASVMRSRILADAMGMRSWFLPQQKAISDLIIHTARWSRRDSTPMLGAEAVPAHNQDVWSALIKQTRSPKPMLAALSCVGVPSSKIGNVKKLSSIELPAGSFYNASAANVSMISDWRQKGSRFALDFSDSDICLEAFGPKGLPLLSGTWGAQVELNEQAQLQLEEWDEVCWFSDDDVDYLEVEAKFGSTAKVQRQAILFRQERLLVLADALLGTEPGKWSLCSQLPLAEGVNYEPVEKTRESYLRLGKQRCLVVPLHLPEWKRQVAAGKLSCVDGCLTSQVESSSGRAYSAMVISLCNRHAKHPLTWRHLTVAESLNIVSRDVAVAYRLQIGGDQWLLYRTLAHAARRTALGMHTYADFFAGRFDAEGDIESLVEVEASEA